MTFKSDFGKRLKEERKKLGFNSQAQIAEMCGVVKDVWGRYERGTSIPNGETLWAFMELGGDITYLFTGSRIDTAFGNIYLSDVERDLLTLFRLIDASEQKSILNITDALATKNLQNTEAIKEIKNRRAQIASAKIKKEYPDATLNHMQVAKLFKPRFEDLGVSWDSALASHLKEKYPAGVLESDLDDAFQQLLKIKKAV